MPVDYCRADVSLYVYRRLYEIAKVLDQKDFTQRAEELIHLLIDIEKNKSEAQ